MVIRRNIQLAFLSRRSSCTSRRRLLSVMGTLGRLVVVRRGGCGRGGRGCGRGGRGCGLIILLVVIGVRIVALIEKQK